MSDDLQVFYEATPNPQSLKFVVTKEISTETVQFDDPLKSQRSPLASKIFGFPWASSIYIGNNFVTITKQDWVDWDVLADPLANLIKEHIEMDEPVLLADTGAEAEEGDENDPPTVKEIKGIINREIRPAVAMDGGDIIFHKYEDNVVYIYMQGACSGCPSASMTLKAGIEARLKEAIPEIKEVVSV